MITGFMDVLLSAGAILLAIVLIVAMGAFIVATPVAALVPIGIIVMLVRIFKQKIRR